MVLNLFEEKISKNDLIKKMHKELGMNALEINQEINRLLGNNEIKIEDDNIVRIDNMELPFEISEEEIRAEEIKAEEIKNETPKKEVSLKRLVKGDNMNNANNMNKYNGRRTGFRVDPELNCTPEQEAFAELVNNNKGRIFDAEQILIHRGCEILFGGAGRKALRYRIAIELNLSDKEPVEEFPLYLDWDDSALYDEGGIADQIRAILGVNSVPKTKLRAVKLGQIAGK